MPAVWERQKNEDDDAWKAFRSYRDQPLPRRLHGRGWPTSVVQRLYSEHAWGERVLAYDRHMDAVRQLEVERAVKEDARIRARAYADLERTAQELASDQLGKLLRLAGDNPDSPLYQMTVSQLVRLGEMGFKMHQLLHEKPTEIVQGSQEVDLSAFSVEELRKWRELTIKASGVPLPNAPRISPALPPAGGSLDSTPGTAPGGPLPNGGPVSCGHADCIVLGSSCR